MQNLANWRLTTKIPSTNNSYKIKLLNTFKLSCVQEFFMDRFYRYCQMIELPIVQHIFFVSTCMTDLSIVKFQV